MKYFCVKIYELIKKIYIIYINTSIIYKDNILNRRNNKILLKLQAKLTMDKKSCCDIWRQKTNKKTKKKKSKQTIPKKNQVKVGKTGSFSTDLINYLKTNFAKDCSRQYRL